MKTIAAALLVALSGKPVTEDAIKAVLKSVGAKENAAEIKNIADALKGKKPEEVIAEGMKKLSSAAPAGGAEHHAEELPHPRRRPRRGEDRRDGVCAVDAHSVRPRVREGVPQLDGRGREVRESAREGVLPRLRRDEGRQGRARGGEEREGRTVPAGGPETASVQQQGERLDAWQDAQQRRDNA